MDVVNFVTGRPVKIPERIYKTYFTPEMQSILAPLNDPDLRYQAARDLWDRTQAACIPAVPGSIWHVNGTFYSVVSKDPNHCTCKCALMESVRYLDSPPVTGIPRRFLVTPGEITDGIHFHAHQIDSTHIKLGTSWLVPWDGDPVTVYES